EADEVRREHDHRLAVECPQVLHSLETHQLRDALARRPPQDAVLHERPHEGTEVRARELLALLFVHGREALLQVDASDLPSFSDQPEKKSAYRAPDERDYTEGKKPE